MIGPDSVLVDAGIDYFTSTATDESTAQLLMLKSENLSMQESNRGFIIKPWSMFGYNGWKCGRLQYGHRDNGAICRLSSDLAASHWFDVWQITERCTRVDVQATVRVTDGPSEAVARMRETASQFYAGRNDGPRITLWSDSTGGSTLYLGVRTSALYFRAYNKEVESGLDEFEGCVRLELEIKNRLTLSAIASLFEGESVQAGILSIIAGYLEAHGISCNWSSVERRWLCQRSLIASDCLNSLAWLRSSVAPTVQRLKDAGFESEAREALGLS